MSQSYQQSRDYYSNSRSIIYQRAMRGLSFDHEEPLNHQKIDDSHDGDMGFANKFLNNNATGAPQFGLSA